MEAVHNECLCLFVVSGNLPRTMLIGSAILIVAQKSIYRHSFATFKCSQSYKQ